MRLDAVPWLSLPVAFALAAAGPVVAGEPVPRGPDAGARALVGRPAPPLPALRWLDGERRDSAWLAGKVVVLRNFTSGCPYCESTLPALDQIQRDFASRGLVVLGVYHPKPPRAVGDDEAARHARRLGAGFPVAVDPTWALVQRWWFEAARQEQWTSITWVLDRRGRIRFVHPGGEYHRGGGPEHAQCRADEQRLRDTLARLLAE
jgi:thiol-disulfide isomerase/thioredoxin